MDVEIVLGELSLEEKAALLSGQDTWRTAAIPGKVPPVAMSDGPNGLRVVAELQEAGAPATCFPTASTAANSWDPDLLNAVGQAMAAEARQFGVSVILGPGTNIKRSPLGGRNFEYFSEDPLLSSRLAAAQIAGIQSQGVGACLKHFAANNQETARWTTDARPAERTLREIYLASFEYAVTAAKPWMIMAAYNRLNGQHCTQNPWLLRQVLREEWGYDGVVVSDWGAGWDAVADVAAGLNLRMPYSGSAPAAAIVEAVHAGQLDEAMVDEAVRRILHLVDRAEAAGGSETSGTVPVVSTGTAGGREPAQAAHLDRAVIDAHHALARRVAGQSAVLLKNAGAVLPLQPGQAVAVIGAMAANPLFEGGGSSHVTPTRFATVTEALANADRATTVTYAPGYRLKQDVPDAAYLQQGLATARAADVVVVVLGTPTEFVTEGADRPHLALPANQLATLAAVADLGKPVVAVLLTPGPVEAAGLDKAAVIAMYAAGQGLAEALADVLFGDVNPSGKLAETWPVRLADTPTSLTYPQTGTDPYPESVFVGYRYYDAKQMPVQYPFGFGLSYTTWRYDKVRASRTELGAADGVDLSVDVTNTGAVTGQEIVQVYVSPLTASLPRPPKELKGFAKITAGPGETVTATIHLDARAFAHWDAAAHAWAIDAGTYRLLAGGSSADLPLAAEVTHAGTPRPPRPYTRETLLGELLADPVAIDVLGHLGLPLDMVAPPDPAVYTTWLADESDTSPSPAGGLGGLDLPIVKASDFSGGLFTEDQLDQVLAAINQARGC